MSPSEKPIILFVCVHNAGRSRMAEAFLKQIAGDRYEAMSAGTAPADKPHPEVVAAMQEEQIAMDGPGRMLTPDLAARASRVIGMGCAVQEACPALTVPLEDWALEDPKGKGPDEVRAIRDEIRRRVRALVDQLDRD